LTVSVQEDQVDGICSVEHCSLREAVTIANTRSYTKIVIPAGFYLLTQGDLQITQNMDFVGNAAVSTVIDGGGTARIFTYNKADGIVSKIKNLTLQHGSADYGGAVYLSMTSKKNTVYKLNIQNSVIRNNVAVFDGGGIYTTYWGTVLKITNSTITGNAAGLNGGGVYTSQRLIIRGSTFSNNVAGTNGGGLLMSSTSNIRNSTFSGNRADADGGGIAGGTYSNGWLYGVTIVRNFADADNALNGVGGGISGGLYGQALHLTHTLIADNQSGTGKGHDCGGEVAFASEGHNLIEKLKGCRIWLNDTDIIRVDPKLDELRDNGGLTQTHLLFSNSPALNGGVANCAPLVTDQRGVVRPIGRRCDIGAVEMEPVPRPSKPVLIAPSPSAILTDSVFSWQQNPDRVTGYRLIIIDTAGQVVVKQNFDPSVICVSGICSIDLQLLAIPLSPGSYRWHVIATNLGRKRPSEKWTFTVGGI
jgi:hypothetical protein